MWLLASILACTPELTLTLTAPEGAVDECGGACIAISLTQGGEGVGGAEVVVDDGRSAVSVVLDDAGEGERCGLPVGELSVEALATVGDAKATARATLDIRPFGYDLGIERPLATLAELPWVPAFNRDTDPVFTAGGTGSWDDAGVNVPAVERSDGETVMWYAGKAVSDYVIGAAMSPNDRDFARVGTNALITGDSVEGSWKRYSTNSPELVQTAEGWRLYYTGRADETGTLSIGVALGTDPLSVEEYAGNPIFEADPVGEAWGGVSVAHPSVLQHPDGHWEMWYSTGLHRIGYAQSLDGLAWDRYCHNPVLEAEARWEGDHVKSAEVLWANGTYFMTYTGGPREEYQLGWAMSGDGLHWVRTPEPVFAPVSDPEAWNSVAVAGGYLMLEGETLRMWYAGAGPGSPAIGYAEAEVPESW